MKQTESHYPYLAIKEEMWSMLNFSQGEEMTSGMYNKKFHTQVAISKSAGCTFMMESLLGTEVELLYPGLPYKSLQATEKA